MVFTLSNSVDYPLNDPTIFENAKTDFHNRVWKQWTSFNWHLWDTYNTAVNNDWFDPWFESETHGNYNGPSTGPDDPAYEQTQNMYGIYCWFRSRGYEKFALSALLASSIHESTVSGGVWELAHPYPGLPRPGAYDPLEGYDAEDTTSFLNLTWYSNSTGAKCEWSDHAINPVTGIDETVDAPSGSWYAAKRAKLVFNADGTYYWDLTQAQYQGNGTGYGLCQFTPWTKLMKTAGHCTTDGSKHWQLNLTLILMVYEYQREQAMTHPTQSGSDYYGEWTDSGGQQSGLVVGGTTYYYGQDLTWDDWCSDAWLPWLNDLIETHFPSASDAQKDWYRRSFALNAYGHCYLHSFQMYSELDFGLLTKYALTAIEYWDANGGASIWDIPRARDIPECPLDEYWLPLLLIFMKRRRKRIHVRTVLF